jgi:hypothetical protein
MSEPTKISRAAASHIALAMYSGEPCRVCGDLLTREVLSDAVFAGYSDCSRSRAAHGECWREGKPKSEWAFPKDAA